MKTTFFLLTIALFSAKITFAQPAPAPDTTSGQTLTPDLLCREMVEHMKELLENNFNNYRGAVRTEHEFGKTFYSNHTFPGLVDATIHDTNVLQLNKYRSIELNMGTTFLTADSLVDEGMMTFYSQICEVMTACLTQFNFQKTEEDELIVKLHEHETYYSAELPSERIMFKPHISASVYIEKDEDANTATLFINLSVN